MALLRQRRQPRPGRSGTHASFPRRVATLLTLTAVALAACTPGEAAVSVDLSRDLLPPAAAVPPRQQTGTWLFGFDERLEPKEDVRMNASLLNWLEEATGLSYGLRTTPESSSVVDELCGGRIQFAIAGTVSYLQANDRCGARILVRGINSEGQDTYRAAIIVGQNAAIDGVQDLRGRSFAFGAPNSTQGYLIPLLMLQQADIMLTDLSAYTFTGSHAATARAVTSGSFDAGGIQDTLAAGLAGRGLVRILALSDPYPSSGIIVGPNVPEKTAEIVKEALLTLDPLGSDGPALYHWDRSEMPLGFSTATDSDYATLRDVARDAGLLEPAS